MISLIAVLGALLSIATAAESGVAGLPVQELEIKTGFIPFTDIKIHYQSCSYPDECEQPSVP